VDRERRVSQAESPTGRDATVETVRIWRPPERDGVLLMHGWTDSYSVDSSNEYFIGVIDAHGMRARRGRAQHLVRPGELVVWDPSHSHSGTPAESLPWLGTLMVVELPDLKNLGEDTPLPDLDFPQPVIRDRRMVADFLNVYRVMTTPAPVLDRQTALVEWLNRLVAYSPSAQASVARGRAARDDPALRRACTYLRDNMSTNVTLDELSRTAGVGKSRLIRLFRAGTGLPPHRYQLAQRIRHARRLLENGTGIVDAAAATGFVDQSHLHRHFRRSLGVTPKQYVHRLTT
jgi:AraC-like DNA-binding protein